MNLEQIELKHLCAQHRARISSSERDALSLWIELFQRGARSYVECRANFAKIYLRAAIEVALVRMQSFSNAYFNQAHLSRPLHLLEHLVEQSNETEQSFYQTIRGLLLVIEQGEEVKTAMEGKNNERISSEHTITDAILH